MISILGALILFCYALGLIFALSVKRTRQYKIWVLIIAIIISLFVNLGNFMLNFSFTEVCTVLCIIACIIDFLIHRSKYLKVDRKSFLLLIFLIMIVVGGHINLSLNHNMPYVLAMNINMDKAYYGLVSPVKATYGAYNRIAFFDLLLFAICLLLYRRELRNPEESSFILNTIRKAYHILFVIGVLEFFFNNFVSPTLMRDFSLSLVGSKDLAKTFYPENRFGYYGITLLFSEQSYVSVLIIYYAIIWKEHVNTVTEMIFYFLSIAILFMSGASTGIVIIPLALVVLIRELINKKQKSYIKLVEWGFVIIVGIIAIYLVATNPLLFSDFLDSTLIKIGALIQGGKYTNNAVLASGATRNYANNLAWEAFLKSPFFGVGLGSTRGYGIWIAFAANFGILGLITFVLYLNRIFSFSLRYKILIVTLVFMYLSIVLSVWYVYMLAFIPLYLCLQGENKVVKRKFFKL